mgnify:CR=1 FL=1
MARGAEPVVEPRLVDAFRLRIDREEAEVSCQASSSPEPHL